MNIQFPAGSTSATTPNPQPAKTTSVTQSTHTQSTSTPTTDKTGPADEVNLSSTGMIASDEFDKAVSLLQKEALEGFTQPERGHFGINAKIDIGRYNLYLVDQQVGALQSKYGEAVDGDALKKQLIAASGITTENPLKGSNRQNFFYENTSFYHLKEKDVQALTDVYIHAKENNLDTEQVNNLASVLGAYRMDTVKYPGLYYPDKRPAYDDELVQQAKAIYSNDGSGVVQFEQEFLDYALSPEKNLRMTSQVLDLDFMQQITGTGDGNKAFLHTPTFHVGEGKLLGTGQSREALTASDQPDSDMTPQEAVQQQLTRWLETHFKPDSPLQAMIGELSGEEQSRLFTQLNLLKLI